MDVKPSLFRNEKTEVGRRVVPHSCFMSDGVRIRTQFPGLDAGLFKGHLFLCPLLWQGGWRWAGWGREKVGLSQRAGRSVLLAPRQHLGHQVPALHGRCPFFLACTSTSCVPPGFKIATHQILKCLNQWDFWTQRTGGLSWLVNLCLYNVFVMISSSS